MANITTIMANESLGFYFCNITISYFHEFTKNFDRFQEYIREVKQYADKAYGRTVKKADLLGIALKVFDDFKSNNCLNLAREISSSWRHIEIKEPPKELAWLYRGIPSRHLRKDNKIKEAQNKIISELGSIINGGDKGPDAETIRDAIRKRFNRREFEQVFAYEVPLKVKSGEPKRFRERYPIRSDDEIPPRLEFLANAVLKSIFYSHLSDRFADEVYRR